MTANPVTTAGLTGPGITTTLAITNEEEDNEGPDLNISKLVLVNNVYSQEWKRSTPLKTYSKKTATSTPNMAAVSRYGRSHKPRIADGFVSTDKKVSQYLKIDADNQLHYFKSSPYSIYKSPNSKSTSSSISSGSNSQQSSPRKRGRPPKIRTLSDSGISNITAGISSGGDNVNNINGSTAVTATKKRYSVGDKLRPNLPSLQHRHQAPVTELNVPIPTSTETLPIPPELMDQTILGSSDIEESEENLTEGEDILDIVDPLANSPVGTTVEMGPDGQPRWMVGDLAWACVGGFPYWPCTVTRDPFENAFTKLKFIGKFRQARDLIHVRFFGDHGRRSWIYKGNILPFLGLDAFLTLAEQKCTPKTKKKFPKLYRSFSVTSSVRKAWQAAVSEAESLKEAPRSERVKYFMEAFPSPPLPINQSPQAYDAASLENRTPLPVSTGKRSRKSLQAIKENQTKSSSTKKRKPETALSDSGAKKIKLEVKDEPKDLDEMMGTPLNTDEKIKEEPETPQKKVAKSKPRKNSSKYNSIPIPHIQAELQVNLARIKEEITPKRMRGRPRKYPKLDTSAAETPPSSTTITLTPTPTSVVKKKIVRKTVVGVNRKNETPNGDTKHNNNAEKKTAQHSSQLHQHTASLEQSSLAASDNFYQQERKKSKLGPGFASFCEKHFDQVADEDPSLTSNDVNKYLEKMWLQLSDAVKARYRSKIQEEIEVESESDTEIESRPSPPQTITSGSSSSSNNNNNKPIKRGVALFSGVKSDKVCSVCFKSGEPGEIIKCKGPCCNYFHLECSTLPRYQQSRFSRTISKKKKRGRPRTVNKHIAKEESVSTHEKIAINKQPIAPLIRSNGISENSVKNILTEEVSSCNSEESNTKSSTTGDEDKLADILLSAEHEASNQKNPKKEKKKNYQKEKNDEVVTKEKNDESRPEKENKKSKELKNNDTKSEEIEKSNTNLEELVKNNKLEEVKNSDKKIEEVEKSITKEMKSDNKLEEVTNIDKKTDDLEKHIKKVKKSDNKLEEVTNIDKKTDDVEKNIKKVIKSDNKLEEVTNIDKKTDDVEKNIKKVIKSDNKLEEVKAADKKNDDMEQSIKKVVTSDNKIEVTSTNKKTEDVDRNMKKPVKSENKHEEVKNIEKKTAEVEKTIKKAVKSDNKIEEVTSTNKKTEDVDRNMKKPVKSENKHEEEKNTEKKTAEVEKTIKKVVKSDNKIEEVTSTNKKTEDVDRNMKQPVKSDNKLEEVKNTEKKTEVVEKSIKKVVKSDNKLEEVKNIDKKTEEVEKNVKKSDQMRKCENLEKSYKNIGNVGKTDQKLEKVEKNTKKPDQVKNSDEKPEKVEKGDKISEEMGKRVKKSEEGVESIKKFEKVEKIDKETKEVEKSYEKLEEVDVSMAKENYKLTEEGKADEDSQSEFNLVINESSNDEDVEMKSIEESVSNEEKQYAEEQTRKRGAEETNGQNSDEEKISSVDIKTVDNIKEKENIPATQQVGESTTVVNSSKADLEKQDALEKSAEDNKNLSTAENNSNKEEAMEVNRESEEQPVKRDANDKVVEIESSSTNDERVVEIESSIKETLEKISSEAGNVSDNKDNKGSAQHDEADKSVDKLVEPKLEEDTCLGGRETEILEKDIKISDDDSTLDRNKEDVAVDQDMKIAIKIEESTDSEDKTEEGLKLQDLKPDKRESSNDDKQSIDSDKSNDKQSIDSDKSQTGKSGWMCNMCIEGKDGPCFICGLDSGDLIRCSTTYCGKVYHVKCLASWPQRQIGQGFKGRLILYCPQHTCHTCISDNPAVHTARYSSDKLVRCVACPSSYHYGNYCIPAGSELLSTTQMICPRHYVPMKDSLPHVNASWCSICAIGGSLICCDSCPNSFHAECLKIDPPEGSFICEDCETGRIPLYGEVVWVKLGTYRWWPAKILYPMEVPENIRTMNHSPVGEFVVEFFGSHDYFWINRGRAFFYHEGDGANILCKNRVDELFILGMNEASEAFRLYQEERESREANCRPSMKPPKYVKIQTNRPYGTLRSAESDVASMTACECDPDKENPCGRNSDCINRLLMVECNPQICPAGEKCHNQNFEKRLYPPLTPFKTETRGWGLKTLVPLKKGDFVIEYVGEMIDEEEYKKRVIRKQKNKDENYYFLTIDKDRMLDAGPKGNMARFMNHSCNPNCETQKWTVNGDTRVGLFTLVDIPAGAELVFNYNLETIGNTRVDCKCGAPSCGGYIGAKAIKQEEKKTTVTAANSKKKKQPKKSVGNNGTTSNKGSSTTAAISTKVTENTCFTCGEGGELLLCDHSSCPKAYHLDCLGLTKHPPGNWECPRHVCSICSSTKVQRCTHCINSYCDKHAEGNITLHRSHGLVCFSCTPSESGSDWSGEPSDDEESTNKKTELPHTVTITKTNSSNNNKSNKLLTSRRGRPLIPNGNLH